MNFLVAAWKHRRMILRMATREVSARYRSSFLGFAWALLHPLLLLAVYTFVFSVIFGARWGVDPAAQSNFALKIFSGLLLYNFVANAANAAPTLVKRNRVLVKQMLFPTEILAWVQVLIGLFDFAVGAAILGLFFVLSGSVPPLTWLIAPAVLVPAALGALALLWGLSVVGAFVEDLSPIVRVGTTALLFLSPVFYSAAQVPEQFRQWIVVNPLAPLLEMWRGALFQGEVPGGLAFAVLLVTSWGAAALGFGWYRRAKPHLADVV